MFTNSQIADTLEQVADLLEFQGANAFRIRAYRNGARAIQNTSHSVAKLAADAPQELTKIEGVGKSVAEKVSVLIQTGSLPQLEALLEEIPGTVLEMLRIPGLGPKKAAVLYQQLHVATLDQLRDACETQQVRVLKGFGAKTEQMILHGMHVAEAAGRRVYWEAADEIVQALRQHLATCPAIDRCEFAGSYRRGKETVGDLDVLVVSTDSNTVMDCFGQFPDVSETIARGDTKMSVRLRTGLQIDLRVVPAKSFGAALQYFTGSKEHNVVLRGRARQQGLKINEYGVFRLDTEPQPYVAGRTEKEVYQTLGLPVFPPELREARQEFLWADQGPLPRLVQIEDIAGDLHMHTTDSDGLASIEEMVEAARKRGLKYVAITDHSQRVTMARGLNPTRLLQQWSTIDQLNQRLRDSFTVLKGIECDILEKGGMDLPDDVLAQADWVVASVHYGQKQPREQITARIVEALENPYVSAIAHPTGRMIHQRDPYQVDMEIVFACAKKHGKLMELNAHPARLDLDDVHCAAAREMGIPIVVNTDAHSVQDLDLMRHGIQQARRAGLTKHDVANSRPWREMKKMIGVP